MANFGGVLKVWKIIAVVGIAAVLLLTLTPNARSQDTTTSASPFLSSPDNSHRAPNGPQATPNDFAISDRVAVIIESRPWTTFVPLLLHFSAVLGPAWPIVLYTSLPAGNGSSWSAPFRREVESGKMQIRALPEGTRFGNHSQVSAFLTGPWLWERLAPARHVLLFQTDSMLCANSAARVEDFFGYAFVGAPIRTDWGEGFNGGLSLRDRELCLRIARDYSWEEAFRGEALRREKGLEKNDTRLDVRYEDQWFYKRMLDLGANLPTVDVALTFAVETINADRPLGFHKPAAVFKDTIERIREWCPEIELATREAFPTSD